MADQLAGPLPPLIHPTTSLEAAVRGNTLGIGYASGGFLAFYYLGISKILQQLGIIKPGFTKTAGTSIGALVQVMDHPGFPSHEHFLEQGRKLSADCLAERNCYQTLDRHLLTMIESIVPDNVTSILNDDMYVTMTRGSNTAPKGDFVHDFKDRQDVVDAVRASAYVPGWSGKDPHIMFHGEPALDGVFSQLLPCPLNISYCIMVSPLPPMDLSKIPEALHDPRKMQGLLAAIGEFFGGAIGPDPLQTVVDAFTTDAVKTLSPASWVKVIATYNQGVATFWPGRYSKTPLTNSEWLAYMLAPPPLHISQLMYTTGQSDAKAWAKLQGWPSLRRHI